MSEEYLFHHGIKGQRWGVRRFQNEDGSRTNAGKARYERMYNKAERYEARREAEIAKIGESKTRLGKYVHNAAAKNAQIKANTYKDLAESRTLGEKLGARVGFGKDATVADAREDFYARQKEYRTSKLGKHLSEVGEYNMHNYGTKSEKVYQSKGLVEKGKNAVSRTLATDIKTIVGRNTKSGERIANRIISKMTNDKVNVTAILDAAYLGAQAIQKVADTVNEKKKNKVPVPVHA